MNDEKYDYRDAITDDIADYIDENIDALKELDELTQDAIFDALYDDMFVSDSITGNASGSYYCNAWRAESSLCHNLGLLGEALEEFGGNYNMMDNAEACDVTIRCYLLSECLNEYISNNLEDIKNLCTC